MILQTDEYALPLQGSISGEGDDQYGASCSAGFMVADSAALLTVETAQGRATSLMFL